MCEVSAQPPLSSRRRVGPLGEFVARFAVRSGCRSMTSSTLIPIYREAFFCDYFLIHCSLLYVTLVEIQPLCYEDTLIMTGTLSLSFL